MLLLFSQMESLGVPVVRLDGSSDELVNVSLLSRLSYMFPDSRPSLLVLDEYHMLAESHKDQLFRWLQAEQRLDWLRVVLIANRIFGHDTGAATTRLRQRAQRALERAASRARMIRD